jgi:hypothetical protein
LDPETYLERESPKKKPTQEMRKNRSMSGELNMEKSINMETQD